MDVLMLMFMFIAAALRGNSYYHSWNPAVSLFFLHMNMNRESLMQQRLNLFKIKEGKMWREETLICCDCLWHESGNRCMFSYNSYFTYLQKYLRWDTWHVDSETPAVFSPFLSEVFHVSININSSSVFRFFPLISLHFGFILLYLRHCFF